MRDTGTVNEEFEKAKKYWQSKFAGEAHEINLPCDFERSLVYKREEYPMGFPADLSNKLLSLSKNQDLLLYVVLLAALKILIFKYTDEPDISIGAPVYIDTTITEPQPGTKRSGAAGETFIIFREILDNNMTFKELLINVKSTLIDAYENQHYVIENMLDVLGVSIPKKILSRIILVLKHFQRREIIQHVIDSPDNDIAIFISKSENGDVLKGSMEYNHKLFKPDTIEWLVKHYLYVLEQVVNNINIKLSDVDLLLDEERKQVLDDFNDTGTLYPRDKTIQALFTDQVEKAPANNAIVSIDNSLTYGLLQEKAGRLAAVLRLKGVTANTIVGLMIESPIEIAIGIMGVLKAGGAYLPIDLEYPTERKEYMLDDSQIALIVTEQHVLTVEQPLLRRFPGDNIIPVDKVAASGGNNISNRDGQLAHGQGGNPDDPAYVIYTSGTTGRPKGVLIRQRGLVNYTCWRLAAYKYTEKDVTLQMLPYGFDGFGSNFYSSLLSGGVLFIVPDSYKLNFNFINEVINQYKVTNLSVVPAIYQMILDNAEGENLKSLRFIVLAGEKSSGALVRKSKEKVPAALLFNEYGPTEATVTAAGSSFIDEFNTAIIGKPIANVHIYLLDSCLKPVPIRVTGELFIAGTGVSQGYLNNPELTAEKFGPLITLMPQMTQMKNKNSALRADLNAFGDEKNLQHSSFSIQHSILYRTGDLARWLPDGNLEIMGRKDSQVKIRGFRIETKEIESRLHEFPGIKEAIVTYFEDQEGEKHLCAYFVSAAAVNIPGLKENLAAALPDYMLPSHFMQLEKIPLTPNGKIDFKVLPVPQREKGSSYLPPRDLLEEKLVDIWADILGLDKGMVGIEHNFFELGGHSLRATKLISRIAKELNLKIPLGEMFKMPTIRALGAYIKNASEDSDSSIIPMEEKEFYGLSYNQQRLWVTYQREPDNPAFNISMTITLPHSGDPGIIKKVFYKIMERHEILRTGLRVMGEQPVQVIGKCSRVNVPLQFMDISEMTAEEKQQRANEIMQQTAAEPFDLTEMPLFRAVHLKLDEQRHYLIISFHHVIIDGFSLDILRQEFFGFYNQFSTGESFAPEPLKLQYKDFAQWQNKKIADPEFKENSQRYWQKKLEAGIPTLELPHDFAGDKKDKRSAIYRCVVDKELTEKLEVLAKANNTSLFTVLFCAYNIVLSHFSGQNEIWSYIVNSGRDHPSLENIVGYFVNSILLGTQVKPDENYIDLLQRVSGDFREALRYQQYAIELVLGGLKMKYPDIVVSFNLLNTNEWDAELAALDFSHMPDMGQLHFNTDIELYARKYKNGIELNWRYKKSLFKPETIENVANGFLKLGRYITEEEEE